MSEQTLHAELPAPESPSDEPETAPSITGDLSGDTPSLEEAKRFLDALAPTGMTTFQSLPEGKTSRRSLRPNTICHGAFDKKAHYLLKLNKAGSGIFVMINKGATSPRF